MGAGECGYTLRPVFLHKKGPCPKGHLIRISLPICQFILKPEAFLLPG
jgi:hypothetical protein